MSTARIRRGVSDPARFEGNGISYKAKLIGIEDVKEARGDLMCQEALIKLKNFVRISGDHKKKIFVNVTLDGLKIIDAISLIVLHSHPVHRISFISRDTTDNRAFGYVFGTEDGLHKFFAIKTATAAEHLVLTLRDLFQVVYEMKKKEMEVAKVKLEKEEITTTTTTITTITTAAAVKENFQSPWAGSTSGTGQTLNQAQKVNADTENIYQVPTNNAPVKPETHAEQVANLLDLEDQAEHILKGIEQIKNLEFDSVTSDTLLSSSSTSPLTNLAPSSSVVMSGDAWGFYSPPAGNSQGNTGGFQAGQFPAMGQQSFQSANFSMQNGPGGSGFNMMNSGLPLAKDPFSNDPFGPTQPARVAAPPGFGIGSGFNQQYGMPNMPPRLNVVGSPGMMYGMGQNRMMSPPVMGGTRSPFGFQQQSSFQMNNPFGNDSSANILQPMKKDAGQDPNFASPEPVKSPTKTREDLFGDLLAIKKSSTSTAISPKDLFAQKNTHERKPMNEMLGSSKLSPISVPQNSRAQNSPFGDAFVASTQQVANKSLFD